MNRLSNRLRKLEPKEPDQKPVEAFRISLVQPHEDGPNCSGEQQTMFLGAPLPHLLKDDQQTEAEYDQLVDEFCARIREAKVLQSEAREEQFAAIRNEIDEFNLAQSDGN